MELTRDTVKTIHLGDVIKVFWIDDEGKRHGEDIGVVYNNDERGILCNREDHSYFGYGPVTFDGRYSFEILHDHAPVKLYGTGYDFVSNHEGE